MAERIRFLADANLDDRIVYGLRLLQPNIDFLLAHDAALQGMPDPEVLTLAASEGRILVSHDRRTMPDHFADFLNSGQHSAGVIPLPQLAPIQEAIEALLLVWRASEPEEWADRIDWMPWK